MYHDGRGMYGCSTCGRKWRSRKLYPLWPIRVHFTRNWSFWRKHSIQGKAIDIEVFIYTTVIHLGFIRLLLGPKV